MSHTKVAEHAYYPFGAEINLTPHESIDEAMKFTGHERDLVAGDGHTLDDMHARYYNASLGRFLSIDPWLGYSRRPQTWNRYAYVNNNPFIYVDPSGDNAVLGSPMWGRCTVMCDDDGGGDGKGDGDGGKPSTTFSMEITVTAKDPGFLASQLFLSEHVPDWPIVYAPEGLWRGYRAKLYADSHPPTLMYGMVIIGDFSISNWEGYPADIPQPAGPFRVIGGDEYAAARNAANNANRAVHRADASLAGKQIHEIQPVKFNGSPTDAANKIALAPAEHTAVTTWWASFLRGLLRGPDP
jgi:RHS repeat-associated protein